MTTVGIPAKSTISMSEAARIGAEAAGRSALAVAIAAENAQKTGAKSSEAKMTIAAMALAGLISGLNALAVIPGPWQLFAVLGLAVAGGSAAYANSRGKVKAAALTEAGTLASATAAAGSGPVALPVG